jgi:hypothetical protein
MMRWLRFFGPALLLAAVAMACGDGTAPDPTATATQATVQGEETATPTNAADPPTPEPTPVPAGYIVQAGDSLTAICQTEAPDLVTEDCITQAVQLNSLPDASQIIVGQELLLPIAGSQPEPTLQEPVQFEVVYTLTTVRFDGGTTLYVLIEPVDLTSSAFKEDVKEVIRTLVAQHGAKTSIEVHDAMTSLEVSYKQYGDLSLGRNRTADEDADQALHCVAAFTPASVRWPRGS